MAWLSQEMAVYKNRRDWVGTRWWNGLWAPELFCPRTVEISLLVYIFTQLVHLFTQLVQKRKLWSTL
jgi:hypothetical protein